MIDFQRSTACSLKPLDIEFLQSVHTKVNIIPVIGFGDALTPEESEQLKMKILQQLAVNEISYYRVPDPDEDEDDQFINNTKALQVWFDELFPSSKLSL